MAVEESQGVPHDWILAKVETLMREIEREEEEENLEVRGNECDIVMGIRLYLYRGNVQKKKNKTEKNF